MNKKYAINIRPYLNKRLKPKEAQVEIGLEDGPYKKAYPLYYQVSYKGKNTHLKSAYLRRFNNEGDGYFVSLNTDKRNFRNPNDIIQFDQDVITRIIRYYESKDDSFTISGFAEYYDELSAPLLSLLNQDLLEYLIRLVRVRFNESVSFGFNFNDENGGTFYFIYRILENNFQEHDIFKQEEKRIFNQVNYLFNLYPAPKLASKPGYPYYRRIPSNYTLTPKKVDLFDGRLYQDLIKKGVDKERSSQIIEDLSIGLWRMKSSL